MVRVGLKTLKPKGLQAIFGIKYICLKKVLNIRTTINNKIVVGNRFRINQGAPRFLRPDA